MTSHIVDLDVVKAKLFEPPRIVHRLVRDYGLDPVPKNPDALAAALLAGYEQTPSPSPLDLVVSNGQVFRAAVRTLGSNNRSWSLFVSSEPELRKILAGYDPVYTARKVRNGDLGVPSLLPFFRGQTGRSDATAVLRWASLLASDDSYYEGIAALGRAMVSHASTVLSTPLEDAELMPCVVGVLGYPPSRWPGETHLPAKFRGRPPEAWKLPGMSYVLGSEFLRNLGWNGFKPDRHIKRLFARWFPSLIEVCRPRARELQAGIGRRTKELHEFLLFSLVGILTAPAGVTLSAVDNLLWTLGAYVETKGNESSTCYFR